VKFKVDPVYFWPSYFSQSYPCVVTSVVIHWCDVKEGTATEEQLIRWESQEEVVAVGETALNNLGGQTRSDGVLIVTFFKGWNGSYILQRS